MVAVFEEFNINIVDFVTDGDNPLHIAAKKRFTRFTKLVLDRGNSRLLNYRNDNEEYPVQVCLDRQHYDTAAVMLKSMNDWYANWMFKV